MSACGPQFGFGEWSRRIGKGSHMKLYQLAVFVVVGALLGCQENQELRNQEKTSSPVKAPLSDSHAATAQASQGELNAKEKQTVKEHRSGTWSPGLTEEEKATLFQIARDTLGSVKGKRDSFSFDRYAITPKLKEKCATFVTFKNKGELRGCMGCLEAVEPMYLSVYRSAYNASRDSRFVFNPIRPAEISEMEIHVSLLSPRRKIDSIDEFKIGQHGIWLEKGGHGAVYLPEVAVEQGWTKEETLSSLSLKAGMSSDAWREGAQFMVYESVVLSE